MEDVSALHLAAQFSSASVVKVILKSGADINARDSYQQTPLHYAAQHNNVEVVRMLIERGANVSAVDNGGKVPLHVAVMNKQFDNFFES